MAAFVYLRVFFLYMNHAGKHVTLSAKVLTAAEVGAKAERTVQHALAKQGAVVTVPKLKGGQGFDAVGTFRSGTDISCINIVEVCPCVLKMVPKTFLDKCVCVLLFFSRPRELLVLVPRNLLFPGQNMVDNWMKSGQQESCIKCEHLQTLCSWKKLRGSFM
jgi:hypothetical protein